MSVLKHPLHLWYKMKKEEWRRLWNVTFFSKYYNVLHLNCRHWKDILKNAFPVPYCMVYVGWRQGSYTCTEIFWNRKKAAMQFDWRKGLWELKDRGGARTYTRDNATTTQSATKQSIYKILAAICQHLNDLTEIWGGATEVLLL